MLDVFNRFKNVKTVLKEKIIRDEGGYKRCPNPQADGRHAGGFRIENGVRPDLQTGELLDSQGNEIEITMPVDKVKCNAPGCDGGSANGRRCKKCGGSGRMALPGPPPPQAPLPGKRAQAGEKHSAAKRNLAQARRNGKQAKDIADKSARMAAKTRDFANRATLLREQFENEKSIFSSLFGQ